MDITDIGIFSNKNIKLNSNLNYSNKIYTNKQIVWVVLNETDLIKNETKELKNIVTNSKIFWVYLNSIFEDKKIVFVVNNTIEIFDHIIVKEKNFNSNIEINVNPN